MTNEIATTEPVEQEQSNMLALIERVATNPEVDVSKMEAIMNMQERVMDKQAEAAFNQDLMEMQKELPKINKNNQVEYPKDKKKPDGPKVKAFKFATYDNIYNSIKGAMQKYGFSVSFTTKMREGGGLIVTGKLLHKKGHSEIAEIPVALDDSGGKNNIQGMGSSFSYGRRYTLTMLLNIVTEDDDDGNSTEPITEAQIDHLQKLIDETDSDTAKICKFAKVNSLPDIQTNQFNEIVKTLMLRQQTQREAQDDNT